MIGTCWVTTSWDADAWAAGSWADGYVIVRILNPRYPAADDAPRERSPSSRGAIPHLREFTTARAAHSR